MNATARSLSTLGRVESLALHVITGHIEEPQERGGAGLELTIERQEFASDLLANLARVIPRLDVEVASDELHDRQERRRPAIRDGASLHEQAAFRAMRVGELPEAASARWRGPGTGTAGDPTSCGRGAHARRRMRSKR